MKLCDAMARLKAADASIRETAAAHAQALSQYTHLPPADAHLMPEVMQTSMAMKEAVQNKVALRAHIARIAPNAINGQLGRLQ